jgi:hypothetical protein
MEGDTFNASMDTRLRCTINAHFNWLSLAAFHPHPLRQGLSSRFFGNNALWGVNRFF